MADLRRLVEELGFGDVSTHLQSGNVLFEATSGAGRLEPRLERAIAEGLAPGVSVVVRTRTELAKVVAANPFTGRDLSKLHVTFLQERPSRARAATLDPGFGAPDEFRVLGRELYLHFSDGSGRSKLSNAYFEKQLGVVATTRNWRTVTALAELPDA